MSTEQYHSLIASHLDFAESLAKKFQWEFQHANLEFDDIRSAAFIGLCNAAQRFEDSRGASFRSFSYMRIRGAMLDAMRKNNNFFSGRSAVSKARKYVEELRDEMEEDWQCRSFATMLKRSVEALGLDCVAAGLDDEVELTYLDSISPEEHSTQAAFRAFVANHLARLPEKERMVLVLRYYEDKSFPEMAPEFNDARTSWLSRIHTRALDRLRTVLPENEVQDWLRQMA